MDYENIPIPPHPHSAPCECEDCLGYLRVSKVGGRGDKLISPELQMTSETEWANANSKRIVGWIADIDMSGRKGGRNAVKRRVAELVERIQAGEAKGVILWKWSRWGRNSLEARIHMNQVEEAGGNVYASTEDIRRDTAAGRLGVGVLIDIAEFESDRISGVWKETHTKRRNDSLPHNSYPRFGYIVEGGRYYVDESLRQVVVDAYEAFAAGKSMGSIAKAWNAAGIKTVRGGRWTGSGSTVRHVLDQGFAAGLIREHSNPKDRRQTLESYDVWREGIHEPIITMDQWNAYKNRRLSNNVRPRGEKYPLSGLLRCVCGAKMVPQYNGKGYKGWTCQQARDNQTHKGNHLSMKIVDDLLLKWIESNIPQGDVDAYVAEILTAKPQVDQAQLKSQLATLDKRLDRIAELVINGTISEDRAKKQRIQCEQEIAELSVQLVTEPTPQSVAMMVRAFITLRDKWDDIHAAGRREALNAILRGVYVMPRWSDGYDPGAPLKFDPVWTPKT